VAVRRLPRDIAEAKTQLVWREGHRSSALDALRASFKSALGAAPYRKAP
jgi:hypothetical protein